VSAAKVQPPPVPARQGKSTILGGVQAPQPTPQGPQSPPTPDDSWDVSPTQVQATGPQPVASADATAPGIAAVRAAAVVASPAVAPVVSPAPPAVAAAPVAPVVAPAAAPPVTTMPVVTVAAAPVQAATPMAAAPARGQPAPLTSADVRLIVRTLLEEALDPLKHALAEAQQHIAQLERRPQAAPVVVAAVAPHPVVSAAQPAPSAPSPTYASAIAAPTGSVVPRPTLTPLLDLEAIERDVPIDMDMRSFDGGRRRRRMMWLFVFGLLVVFGGLFALLAESYTHAHN
jgi:hypothetical protein